MDAKSAETFLSMLFGDAPKDTFFLLWSLPKKYSSWFRGGEVQDAVSYAESIAENSDIYVGVGLAPKPYGLTGRCKQKDIAGIVGMWADLDIADPVHKKGNLPPDIKAVKKLLDGWVKPTVLVDSGHGAHAWWLFKEPWVFEDDADRSRAARMASAWIATLREKAQANGWTVDPVIDLSRVLRLPGAMNRKTDPVPVRIIESGDKRFDVDELEGYILDSAWQTVNEGGVSVKEASEIGALTLDAQAVPPFEKFSALMENDDKFKSTWERTRKDIKDGSPSGFDLALANIAYASGWGDQEITNLLIACRRKHGDDLKLRDKYYRDTIARAKASRYASTERAHEEAISRVDEVWKDAEVSVEAKCETTLKEISALLGVEIRRFVKYTSDPPSYRLFTKDRSVPIKTTAQLMSQASFAEAIVNACNWVIPQFKPKIWRNMLQQLLNSAEQVDVSSEATEEGAGAALIRNYLDARPATDEKADGIDKHRAFVDDADGETYIFSEDFRSWLESANREWLTPPQVCVLLRSIGCEPKRFPARTAKGKPTTTSAWRVPSEYAG